MAYVKIDTTVPRHPKFIRAGGNASWLWLCMLAYCQDNLTDGFIPTEVLPMFGNSRTKACISKLLRCQLLVEAPSGYCINDYLDHNASADERRKAQAQYRKNGAKGGRPPKTKTETTLVSPTETKPKPSVPIAIALASALVPCASDQRGTPIVHPRRKDAAWEGARGLYVPQRKHQDFIQLRNHPRAEAELLAWYAAVAETYRGEIDVDMFRFWSARYGEHWPPTKAASSYATWRPATARADS